MSNPATPEQPLALIRNAAVQHCCNARLRALQNSKAAKLDSYDTRKRVAEAYRQAMPDLAGAENIRDFIACVAQAMLLQVIDPTEAPKLLYAAQVALGTLRYQPKAEIPPA
jgi:hypothetical protein